MKKKDKYTQRYGQVISYSFLNHRINKNLLQVVIYSCFVFKTFKSK